MRSGILYSGNFCKLCTYVIGFPPPVTNLSLDSVQCRSVNISWEKAVNLSATKCGQESYRVSVISVNPPGGVVKTGGGFENIFSVTGLNTSTTYAITVTTRNRVGNAEPSSPIIFTTMDEFNFTSPNGKWYFQTIINNLFITKKYSESEIL